MEARVAQLEREVIRLQSEFERLQRSLSSMHDRQRERSLNRALLACYLVITAVLYGAMAIGFGWV